MDLQKIATYSSAAAVVGTGAIVGGGQVIDNMNDGPTKRQEAQIEQIRQVVAEEVFKPVSYTHLTLPTKRIV